MTGYHTRWLRPEAKIEDPERIAIREALAFGKALYDRRCALGLSVADLAQRTGMTIDEIECTEKVAPSPPSICCGAWPGRSTPTCALPQVMTSAPSGSKPMRPPYQTLLTCGGIRSL
jgi:hypothetical protein